jgi:hypothetical protein
MQLHAATLLPQPRGIEALLFVGVDVQAFAASSALAASDAQRAAAVIQIGFGERERFLDAQPCAPQDHDQAAQPPAVGRSPAARMTAMISSMGGSAG